MVVVRLSKPTAAVAARVFEGERMAVEVTSGVSFGWSELVYTVEIQMRN